MTWRRALALAAAAVLAGQADQAGAAEPLQPVPLDGALFIAGASVIDPPDDERRDTHAYISVSGLAARRLFVSMKVASARDTCTPGRQLKRSGAIVCSVGREAKDAQCDFALDLVRGRLAPGTAC